MHFITKRIQNGRYYALNNTSRNARYSLNKACVKNKIPFVTGAAVGISGQVFTILPKESACYHCLFPALDEDSMPTCSIEGVHPSILSNLDGTNHSLDLAEWLSGIPMIYYP